MAKLHGVVLEQTGPFYTILAEDGSFRRMRLKVKAAVGEEISVETGLGIGHLKAWASLAAAFLLVALTALGWNWQQPVEVAYVSIDINPSLELALDADGKVAGINASNSDAESLLVGLDLKRLPVNEAVSQIVGRAVELKYLNSEHDWVVVGVSYLPGTKASSFLNSGELAISVNNAAEKQGVVPKVAVFQLTESERDTAQQEGLTLGQYALWQAAATAGVEVNKDALKVADERVKLLNQPAVQEQIHQQKNVLELTDKKDPSANSPAQKGGDSENSGDQSSDNHGKQKTDNSREKGYKADSNQGKGQEHQGPEKEHKENKPPELTENNIKNNPENNSANNSPDETKISPDNELQDNHEEQKSDPLTGTEESHDSKDSAEDEVEGDKGQ